MTMHKANTPVCFRQSHMMCYIKGCHPSYQHSFQSCRKQSWPDMIMIQNSFFFVPLAVLELSKAIPGKSTGWTASVRGSTALGMFCLCVGTYMIVCANVLNYLSHVKRVDY